MSVVRPHGTTSRVRRVGTTRHPWVAHEGQAVDLPVVVDIMHIDPISRKLVWQVEAKVDLVDDFPAIVEVRVRSESGIDPAVMQAKFRWATPLEVVTQTMPELLAMGVDPFRYEYPVTGFPKAAYVERTVPTRLTDAFLEAIVVRYLALGRGYAKAIAAERNVSPRTAVSWIEKARARGILTATERGVVGGGLARTRPTGGGRSSRRGSGRATTGDGRQPDAGA